MKLIFVLPLLIMEILPGPGDAQNPQVFNYNFQQNDYIIKFERVELVHYNKDYYNTASIRTFKHNRTCAAVNATFEMKIDFGYDVELIIQAYKFMSNEYRYFPMRFQVNLCMALNANMMGVQRLFDCGNFHGCPLQKNKANHVCNWSPDTSKFPPLMPNGEYKLEVQGMYHQQELCVVAIYGSVTRPITKYEY